MGGGLKNKAFTLIELLAIIVLAIIAVITVPIILNVIDESKRGAAIDSAYGYRKAVNQHYLTKLANDDDFELDGFYTINNEGALTQEDSESIPISFTGTNPKDGMVYIDNGNIIVGCITINDYKVKITSEEIEYAEKGNCLELPQISGEEIEKGKYYDTEIINDENQITTVYFNPTTGFRCLKKEYESNDQKLGKTGCMKWYAYSEFEEDGNTYVNMILDHNTTLTVDGWINKITYNGAINYSDIYDTYGVKYPNNIVPNKTWNTKQINAKGPLTVLNQLHIDTDNWNLPNRSDSYAPVTNSYSNYTIDYSGYKTRLISAEEVAKITKMNTATSSNNWMISGSSFYFDSLTAKQKPGVNKKNASAYAWLFTNLTDCESYGCKDNKSTVKIDTTVDGYWSSSPNANREDTAWGVYYYGDLHNLYIDLKSRGIRPVITVPKYIFN